MWTRLELSTCEDETLNNAFCTNGLFKIGTEENVEPASKEPTVHSRVQNGRMIVAVEETLVLLRDENSNEASLTHLKAKIDCIAMSASGNIVVSCLSDGSIVGNHIQGSILFEFVILQEDIYLDCGKTFQSIVTLDNDFYIMTVCGKLYRLSNVDEQLLSETLINNSEIESMNDETLLNNAILERVSNVKHDSKVESFLIINHNGSKLCIYSIGQQLVFHKLNKPLSQVLLPNWCSGLKSIYNFDSYIVGLSHEGDLIEICPYTQLVSKFDGYNFKIEELIVTDSNSEEVELMILTKGYEDNERFAKILSFPSMNAKNEMNMIMHVDTWLVIQSRRSLNMYYLNGIRNDAGVVHEIEMKLISETEPSQRLKKLIQREHFTEAEDFAKEFELSMQPIYEAKARKLCNEIAFVRGINLLDKFHELLKMLQLIESKVFFISVIQYEFPDRNLMKSFLEFVAKFLEPNENSNEIKIITEKLLRLETLSLIDPTESYTDWREFINHTHLLKFCKKMFSANFAAANLIWSRHSASILPYATIIDLHGVLKAIPDSVEPFEIVQWFKHFAPNVFHIFPLFMSEAIEWSIKRTKHLQNSTYWPEIGLEFMNNINDILKDIKFLYSDTQRKFETAHQKIKNIIIALEDLSVLKKSYNLIVTLDDYIKDSMEDTAFNLLKCVQLSNMKALVTDFLYPIFKENGENPENAIKRYVQFVAIHKSYRDWSERAIVAIEFLNNENDKLNAVLLTLKSSTVPWTPAIQGLIKYGEGSHPIAREIYVQFKNQTINVLKKKYEWPLDTSSGDSMLLVKRIVYLNRPEMLSDVRAVILNEQNIAMQANTYIVITLLKTRQVEKALNYFKELPNNELGVSFQFCMSTLIRIIDTEDLLDPIDCLELMKSLNDYVNGGVNDRIKDVEKVLKLREYFKLEVNISTLCKVESLLKAGITFIIDEAYKNYKESKECFSSIFMNLKKLSALLDLNILTVIFEACTLVSNNIFTLNFIVSVLNLIEIEKNLVPASINLGLLALEQHLTSTIADVEEKDLFIFPILHKFFERARSIDTLHTIELNELMQWTMIGIQFYTQSHVEKMLKNYLEKFPITKEMLKCEADSQVVPTDTKPQKQRESLSIFDAFEPVAVQDHSDNLAAHNESNLAIKCLSMALKLVILKTPLQQGLFKNIFEKLDDQVSHVTEEELVEELLKLVKNQNHMKVFLILQLIKRFECCNKIEIVAVNNYRTLKYKILRTVISQKEPNFTHALKILLSDSHSEQSLKALKDTMNTETYIINYFTLLEKYYHLKQQPDQEVHAKSQRMQYQYHQELSRLNPSLKFKKNLDFSSPGSIMNELSGTLLSIHLIQRMCNDFHWNYEEALANQLIAYLMSQKPEFEIITDVFEKEELLVRNDAKTMIKVCQPYVNEIKDRLMLARKLKDSFKQFNYYFYELYLCGIEILSYIDCLPVQLNLWENILKFLIQQSSVRNSRPSQLESDCWSKISSIGTVLPKISKYRLPFYPLIENPLKAILEDEICVETCEKWLPLIQSVAELKGEDPVAEVEYFIMAAVKKSMLEPKNNNSEEHTWHLTETNSAFLQTVLRLVTHMQAKFKIAFILYYISNNSPEGIDKLNATKECYKYVIENEQQIEQHPKAIDLIKKIKDKYPILRIHHILHVYGLVEERLMNLAVDPYKLIHELYYHESIVKDQKVDINRVVADIGNVSNTAYESIQVSLLQKWLGFECDMSSNGMGTNTLLLEDTIQNDLHNGEEISDESVMRAYYILKSWDISKAMDFLMYEIMEKCSSNTAKELQLVECYSKLSENGGSLDDLISSDHYHILKCVHDLRQIGYKMNKEKFKSIEKLALLKDIWKKHADDRKGIELVMYICLGFEIYEPQIWNGVLKQMVAMSMTQQLSSLVLILSARSELLHISALVSAWFEVIKTPFKYCTKVRSCEQEMELSKALILLQSCPLSNRLDYIELTELCLRLNRPHIAAIFTVYAEEKQVPKIVEMLKPFLSTSLKSDIKELVEQGVLKTIVQTAIRNLSLHFE